MIGPLGLCLAVPVGLAVVCVLQPGARASRWLALLGSVFTLVVGGIALANFANHPGADFRFVETHAWSEWLGASLTFGVDGIGAAMLALSGLVTLLATLATRADQDRPRLYHALVLLLLAAMNGVFTTLDLLVFYVCWEAVLLPMLPLIGLFGGQQRRYAALKFFVYTLAGSVLMLAFLLGLWATTPSQGRDVAVPAAVVAAHGGTDARGVATVHGLPVVASGTQAGTIVHVPRGFDLRHLAMQHREVAGTNFLGTSLALFGFLAVLLACLVKVPAVPLHTWLPHAHVQAPTAVSVLLAGVLLKLGVYGIYRIALPLFPGVALAHQPMLAGLGVLGILYGAYAALGQRDLKRLVAYSSVSHMGFCLLGAASGTTAGVVGGMVQAVTHGLTSSFLFLLVGVVYERAHHRRIDGFGGLMAPMPRFAWLLLLGCMAGCGLPGLAGFVGEFAVLSGAFTAPNHVLPICGALAAVSVVFAAAYSLTMVQKVAFGPLVHAEQRAFADLDRHEAAVLLPLAFLIVLVGVCPAALVDALRPACDLLLAQLQGGRP